MQLMVTGGAGFIGSHVIRRLTGTHRIVVVDNRRGDSVVEPPHGVESHDIDICDTHALAEAMEGCDAVIHLASSVLIKGGHLDTRQDLQQNLLATHSVLEAMRLSRTPHVCFASSSTVYGAEGGATPLDERTPLRPISLYGAAKAASECYIHAYAHLFGLSGTILRLGIVLGPGLRRGAAFDFFQRLRDDPERLTVLGDGSQSKPYLDIDDCTSGFIQLGLAPHQGVEVFNLSSEGAMTVRELAREVLGVLELEGVHITTAGGNAGWPGDVPRLELATDRARAAGWSCRYTAAETVRRYVRSLLAAAEPGGPR